MKLKSKDLKEGDWVNIYSEFGCSKVVEIWISDGKLVGYDYANKSTLSEEECEDFIGLINSGAIEGFSSQ